MSYKDQITRLRDTQQVVTQENWAPMVILDPEIFRIQYLKPDMVPLIGNRMFARQPVVEKLTRIQEKLNQDGQGYQLHIAYAYRSPEIQQQYFLKAYQTISVDQSGLSKEEMSERAHSMVADPQVAGHPTGAAVDLTLWNKMAGASIDMGSGIAEFGDIAYTNFPDLTDEQKHNRLYLQKLLMNEDFAPFLGEWWHFSYGDKEWAYYYRRPNALYDIVPLSSVQRLIN